MLWPNAHVHLGAGKWNAVKLAKHSGAYIVADRQVRLFLGPLDEHVNW